MKEAAADAEKSIASKDPHFNPLPFWDAPPWEFAIEQQARSQALLFLGKLDEAAKVRDEVETLATKIGQSYPISRSLMNRAWVDFGRTGNLQNLETAYRAMFQFDPKAPRVFWDVLFKVQLSLTDFLRGDWSSALQHAEASCRLEKETSWRGMGVGTYFRQLAYLADRAAALEILRNRREWLPKVGRPNMIGSWMMLALAIEGLAMLGDNSSAGGLYPLARQLVGTGAVELWQIFRFTHTVAGMAAAAARQWEAAEHHFQTALHHAEDVVPFRAEQAEIRRFHAMMMMDRAAPGDREKAR